MIEINPSKNALVLILDTNLKYQSLSLILNLYETQAYSAKLIVLYVFESLEDKSEYTRLIQELLKSNSTSNRQDSLNLEVIFMSEGERDTITNELELAKGSNITRTTFLRLFLSTWLPSNLERILYLDIDILVKRSLEDLFSRKSDFVICAVKGGSSLLSIGSHLQNFNSAYFNAGVLLIDIDKWRKLEVESEILKIGQKGSYPLMDQDILNLVFKGEWTELSADYNVQQMPDSAFRFKDEQQSPAIVHFVGGKPWNESRSTAYVNEYRFQFNKIRCLYPLLRDWEDE
jgi:lipopolysaccharide biosynthesis glycosyltransferase